MKKIAVIGGGKFGLAMAYATGKSEASLVYLFSKREEIVSHINQSGTHPDNQTSMHVVASSSLKDVVEKAEVIFFVVPSEELNATMVNVAEILQGNTVSIIICTKGVEGSGENLFFYESAEKIFTGCQVGMLSGPSFAAEILKDTATFVNLASKNVSLAIEVQNVLSRSSIKIMHTEDVKGVQILGAYKNVIGLRIGIEEGIVDEMISLYGESANACRNKVAALFVELVKEATILVDMVGGKKETIFSYAGIGDIILTSSSPKSRNTSFGRAVGKLLFKNIISAKTSKDSEAVVSQICSDILFVNNAKVDYESIRKNIATQGQIAEGKYATKKLADYAQKHGINLPHLSLMKEVLYG